MPIIANASLARMRAGRISVGFGVHHLRTAAVPALAKAAGYDWLFIDMEHGAFSVQEATQLCLAALPVGIAPLVRVCTGALDEGTRALDNGAQGIIVPHVDTPELARRVADAFRFPPEGHRSWGGPVASHGFLPPAHEVAQEEINREVMIVAMIETAEAVANVEAIAATPGIDCLFIGTSDLTADIGIPGQIGHERVVAAYEAVIGACQKHGKFAGVGGVYDDVWAPRYLGMGARFILAGSDQQFLFTAARARAAYLNALE
ncbi:MAG: aldolase/citrate lyase family protein [Devosia sp.]|nr:aldolase/citrate lyase family protein [Devosia sp.]